MTDATDNAPDRIWAVGLWNSEPGNWTGGHWDLHQDFSGDVEYRRADLPATDAQVMAHPKVRVLVEAARRASAIMERHGLIGGLLADLDAALAALTKKDEANG
jgi:hypothetical protein